MHMCFPCAVKIHLCYYVARIEPLLLLLSKYDFMIEKKGVEGQTARTKKVRTKI